MFWHSVSFYVFASLVHALYAPELTSTVITSHWSSQNNWKFIRKTWISQSYYFM